MDITEIVSTLIAGVILLGLSFVTIWWFIKYGIEEIKEQRKLRKLLIEYLTKKNNE